MNRRSFLAAVAAAPAAGLLSGCGRSRANDRTLRLAYRTDYKSMDPAAYSDASVMQALRLMYQGLIDCDDDMKLVPWLAEAMPEVSADKKIYTFRVKKGVRFANGREVTADDFAYPLERLFDPATKTPGLTYFSNIRGGMGFQKARRLDAENHVEPGKRVAEPTQVEGLRVLGEDRRTLQIELEQPDLSFLWLMTMPYAYALPREAVEHFGDDFYRNSCGSGPYVLKEWQRGLRLRFEPNPYYPKSADTGVDAIEVLIGYDDMTQTMMFERGELDLINVPVADYVRLSRDPRWKPQLLSMPLAETDYLVMNCQMAPFTDVRVRQAVCYAVNRERITRIIHGMGVPANSLVPPGVFGHDPNRKGYPYDPARARKLLAEANHPKGFEIELAYSTDGPLWAATAAAVQQDLRLVGIRVTLNEMANEVFNTATGEAGKVRFSIYGYIQDYPDAIDFLGTLCDSEKATDTDATNLAFYKDPTFDEWIHAAATTTDLQERLDLYRKAETWVLEQAPYCVLYHEMANYLCQPRVKNCTLHPLWLIRFEDLRLEQS